MEPWREELYHHGILGQKWGKRNGPPYPLSNNAHSLLERKMNGLGDAKSGREPRLLSFIRNKNEPRRLKPWRTPRTVKQEFSRLNYTNPLHQGLFVANNCANTALAAVGRLKGYDVMPGWQRNKFGFYTGMPTYEIIDCFKNGEREYSEYPLYDFNSQQKAKNKLAELYEDGSYGIIVGTFKVGWKEYGHAMTWQVKNGKTCIADTMNGVKASKIFDRQSENTPGVGVLRCNDLDIDWEECSKRVIYR